MDIKLHAITISELVDGFVDNDEKGVVGYGGKLNIRPPYQREFIYSDAQQKEVIHSIFKGFPLNVMYWVENEDGTYELLDGQQRTLSICSFAEGELAVTVNGHLKSYDNLDPSQKKVFDDYTLQVYICRNGTDTEKLDWFRIINIAGEKLTRQELLNAVYYGPWISDLKKRFAKTGCVAMKLGGDYLTGSPLRQDYVQTVLRWISGNDVEAYMAKHQHDANSDVEWQYFQKVIAWVRATFPNYRSIMAGLDWGGMYNMNKDRDDLVASKLEEEISALLQDDDVTNQKGVYPYVLSGHGTDDMRHLSIRKFSDSMKRAAYERQKGFCVKCGKHFPIGKMQADHIVPWSKGGKTTADNCQLLCQPCNGSKGNR